jgi:hypothetical protein
VIAVNWGIAPSEFWSMSPVEWWLIYEAKRPRDRELDYAGSLNESEVSELFDMMG